MYILNNKGVPVIGNTAIDTKVINHKSRNGWENDQSEKTKYALKAQITFDFCDNRKSCTLEHCSGSSSNDTEDDS